MKKIILTTSLILSSLGANAYTPELATYITLQDGETAEVEYGLYKGIKNCSKFDNHTDICVNKYDGAYVKGKKKYSFKKLVGVVCGEDTPQQEVQLEQGGSAIRSNVSTGPVNREEFNFYVQSVIEFRYARSGFQYEIKVLKSGERSFISNERTGKLTTVICK